MNVSHLIGTKITGKIARWGFPVMTGKVISVRNALLGNVRVKLEDGTTAMMLYPTTG